MRKRTLFDYLHHSIEEKENSGEEWRRTLQGFQASRRRWQGLSRSATKKDRSFLSEECLDGAHGSALKTKNMLKNYCLNSTLTDTSFSGILGMISLQSEPGRQVVRLSRRLPPVVQAPHTCGWKLDELKLSIRIRTLTHCGAVHDSDENTAKNIRAEGIQP